MTSTLGSRPPAGPARHSAIPPPSLFHPTADKVPRPLSRLQCASSVQTVSVQLCTHQLTPLPDSTTHLPWPPVSGTSPASHDLSGSTLPREEPGVLTRGEAAFLFAVEVLIGGHDNGDDGDLGGGRAVSAPVLGGEGRVWALMLQSITWACTARWKAPRLKGSMEPLWFLVPSGKTQTLT